MKKSFVCAAKGIKACLQSERNMRIHISIAFYVIIAGAITNLEALEWALIILCISAVTGAELVNTAVEKLCDKLYPKFSEQIGKAKDMAAGAVLACAIASAAIGSIIFFNAEKIGRALDFIKTEPVWAILIILTLPVMILFIFGSKKK